MIPFVLFYATFVAGGFMLMRKQRKKAKEIAIFAIMALAGFVQWFSIMLDRTLKPIEWIGRLIDWMRL